MPTPPATPATTTAATLDINLCGLLSWADLDYPDAGRPGQGPTYTGNQPGWSQFCQWTAWEFKAGYTPPDLPDCNSGGSAAGAAQCAADDAGVLAQITANSAYINVGVGWKPEHILMESTSTYTQDGHLVVVNDKSANWTCVTALHWAEGTLEVEVQDNSQAFGTPCAQATRFTNLLIAREPH